MGTMSASVFAEASSAGVASPMPEVWVSMWRSVTPLLPEREDRTRREEPGGGAAAMAQLLRKHVGRGELLATCRREWKRAGGLLPRWQRQREWEAGTGGVVEEYRRMQEFVRERPEL